MLNDIGSLQDAVVHQILKGCHVDGTAKATTALGFADVNGVCNIFQSNRIGVILLNKNDGILDTDFIRRHGTAYRFRLFAFFLQSHFRQE